MKFEASLAGTGGLTCSLRVSPSDGAIAEGRLARECKAHLSAVPGGRVDCAHEATTASPKRRRRATKPVLEHGFCQ